jgi:fatty acid desaturase
MRQFAVYMVGLVVVLAAIWALLVYTGVSDIVPIGIVATVLVLLLGFGLMRASGTVDEHPPAREVTETRQQVGDTEIRRSKLE